MNTQNEAVDQEISKIQELIAKETDTLSKVFGIENVAGELKGHLPRKAALKMLNHIVSGMYGMDRRIKEMGQAAIRSAGMANMAWNLINVVIREYGNALVKLGVYKDEAEMEAAFKDMSKVLMEEAIKDPMDDGTVDRVARHIGDLVKANNKRIAEAALRKEETNEKTQKEAQSSRQGNGIGTSESRRQGEKSLH